jgi:tRNA(fMet)-specific endonuclease VapC
MKRFAQIRGQLRRQGQLIGDMDVLIAATALHHGLVLVTANRRHFDRVPNLMVYTEG